MHAKLLQLYLTLLRLHGLEPGGLLCSWDSVDRNTGVGCHALLQGIAFRPGMETASLVSPAASGGVFTTSAT